MSMRKSTIFSSVFLAAGLLILSVFHARTLVAVGMANLGVIEVARHADSVAQKEVEASIWLDRALQMLPPGHRRVSIERLLGLEALHSGDLAVAIHHWFQALAYGTDEPLVVYHLVPVLVVTGEESAAMSLIESQNDPHLLYALAVRLASSNQPVASAKAFERAQTLGTGTLSSSQLARAYKAACTAYRSRNQPDEALKFCRLLVEHLKTTATFLELGRAYFAFGEYELAREAIADGIALGDLWAMAPAYYWLGRSWSASGLPDQAVEAWQRAIAFDPSYPYPRLMLARVYLAEGRKEEATEQLTIAAQSDRVDVAKQAQQLLETLEASGED